MGINGDGEGGEQEVKMEERKETTPLVFMWGYLPGALPQRSPLLSPTAVRLQHSIGGWKDVCGGGCGFAMAISGACKSLSPLSAVAEPDTGKLITWGATDDLGQSYVTSGKHSEMPEPFLLPTEAAIVQAAAGWAHCVAVTETKEVYTWGWKEYVPSGKVFEDASIGLLEKEVFERQVTPRSQGSRSCGGAAGGTDSRGGEESAKRRRTSSSSSSKQPTESSSSGDESLSALPCLVTLQPGVTITTVAAGGRHTLALSDIGQVWGWGYGGEGQLGLGSRTRVVSSPHLVPCIDPFILEKQRSTGIPGGRVGSEAQGLEVPRTYVKGIACGGRHSVVITDAGELLTFGWGLYGQCGQGSTDDELSPACVSSLLGIRIQGVAAGLWHTVCISADGDVYAFGGNQFGQLGTGSDQAETLPRLLDAPCLENEHARIVSCGARHSTVVTENCKVFCWGWNKYGQLGLGDVIDRNIPAEVSTDGCVAKNVSCGWWHTLLLAESPT